MDIYSLMRDVDGMDGERFERFVCWLFQVMDYRVIRVGTTLFRSRQRRIRGGFYQNFRDFGADLIVEKEGIKIAIQAKRCKRLVGLEAVKQAIRALKHYQCHKALVVSNNNYTGTALKLAKRRKIELWGRSYLLEQVSELTKSPV